MATSATATQLSGLVSGFDWSTYIDSLIEYSSVPITNMENEQATNTAKIDALSTLNTKMVALQVATDALADSTSFYGRTSSLASSTSTWSTSADTGTTLGSYKVSVTQLATAAKYQGTSDIGSGLSATSDVSGLTLATLPVGTAITAGTFTVNGQQITIDLSESLQDVFDTISTATGGEVTAAYDPAEDKISFTSSSGEIVFGAANDTSNFLTSLKLANNGTDTVTSSSTLGALQTTATLDSANLRSAITAVDGSGNGSFTVNGVEISYNVTTDSLKTIIARINASSAGVTASYDAASDRMVLNNKVTGDTGISVSETSGGLMDALGLTTGTLSRGKNTLYSINDGPELISTSNTLTSSTHGIEGLRVSVNSTGTDTITVGSDTDTMMSKIETFISAYNAVQDYIDEKTEITTEDGEVTTGTLTDEREVSSWSQTLRRKVFEAVSGLSGSISRLESLGIDFVSGTDKLEIKDSTKLQSALEDSPDDVAAFFTTSSTGFAARLTAALDLIAGNDYSSGYIETKQDALTAKNKSLDEQIAAFERQLEQQRELLTASFIAMETAQSTYNNMQTQLTNAFSSDSSSS